MSRRTALSTRQQPLQTHKGSWALSQSAFFTKQGNFSALNLRQVLFSNSSPFAGLGTQTTRKHRNGKTQSNEGHLRKDLELEVSPRAHLETGHTSFWIQKQPLFKATLNAEQGQCICMCPFCMNTARDKLLKLCRRQEHQNAFKSSKLCISSHTLFVAWISITKC